MLGIAADRISTLRSELDRLAADGDIAPPPLLNGDTLVAEGYSPGPAFKRVLDEVYDAQLELRVTTVDAALSLARDLLRSC